MGFCIRYGEWSEELIFLSPRADRSKIAFLAFHFKPNNLLLHQAAAALWCQEGAAGSDSLRERGVKRSREQGGQTFDFCLSTSIPVLTTSTCAVAWPQGDQFLGGGM